MTSPRASAFWVKAGRPVTDHQQEDAWATKIRGATLRDRVCAEKLVGAREFRDEELADPILSGIDKDDPVARKNWEYYAQTAARWGRWIGQQWVNAFPAKAMPAAP